ncbi:MAG: hypothetical protein ACK41P_04100 [Asticcacaulis sp.]
MSDAAWILITLLSAPISLLVVFNAGIWAVLSLGARESVALYWNRTDQPLVLAPVAKAAFYPLVYGVPILGGLVFLTLRARNTPEKLPALALITLGFGTLLAVWHVVHLIKIRGWVHRQDQAAKNPNPSGEE